jgi:hypothetical protein
MACNFHQSKNSTRYKYQGSAYENTRADGHADGVRAIDLRTSFQGPRSHSLETMPLIGKRFD